MHTSDTTTLAGVSRNYYFSFLKDWFIACLAMVSTGLLVH